MREVQGARHEPPLYSCARCFVTRRRRSWAIAMGITKKNRIVPPRAAAAAAVWSRGCLCSSGTSNTGITQDRVIPQVLPSNTWP